MRVLYRKGYVLRATPPQMAFSAQKARAAVFSTGLGRETNTDIRGGWDMTGKVPDLQKLTF